MVKPRHTHTAADLRAIARCQQVLIFCLLGQLFIWVGFIVLRVAVFDDRMDERAPMIVVGGLTVLLGLVGGVFVYLMGSKVSGFTFGVMLGILTVVPCLGLVMILVANISATSLLQSNGVRVGLLGAKSRDLDALSNEADDEEDDEEEEEPQPRRKRRRRDAINEDEGW